MGNKKRKRKMRDTARGMPIASLENMAQVSLKGGRFRQARDYFKRLCEYDREK